MIMQENENKKININNQMTHAKKKKKKEQKMCDKSIVICDSSSSFNH